MNCVSYFKFLIFIRNVCLCFIEKSENSYCFSDQTTVKTTAPFLVKLSPSFSSTVMAVDGYNFDLFFASDGILHDENRHSVSKLKTLTGYITVESELPGKIKNK